MSSKMSSTLKMSLKLAVRRLRAVQEKKTAVSKLSRREMAQLLDQGKVESAKIRVENIIREDISVELMEILELYCELLLARIGMMEGKECDPGLEEAVKSIIYAAPRTEVKELHKVRELLVTKYGKDFSLAAMENSDEKVSPRVIKKLAIEPPAEELVTLYLKEIARTYGVRWGQDPPPAEDDDGQPGSGALKAEEETLPPYADEETEKLAQAVPPSGGPASPIRVVPPPATTENLTPKLHLPKPAAKPAVIPAKPTPAKPAAKAPAKDLNDIDPDDLEARFAALRKW